MILIVKYKVCKDNIRGRCTVYATYPATCHGPVPPEAYFLVVGGSVPLVERVPPALGVPVKF